MSVVDLERISDGELVDLLQAALANRRRRLAMDEDAAEALSAEIAEILAMGETPTIGVYRRYGRRSPVPDIAEWVRSTPGAMERVVETIREVCEDNETAQKAVGVLYQSVQSP